jgi:hypothetical protein
MIHVMRLSIVAVIVLACSSDGISAPPAGFTHAVAAAECGPADGPATAIYLAPNPIPSLEPSGVYVRISVPVGHSSLTDHLWQIGENSEAGAWLHITDSNSQVAESGYLIVSSVDADNTIVGSVDVRFPNGQRVRGGFTATWDPRVALCV